MKITASRLINGRVLTLSVDLAAAIGLEEAIIIQQLHWWLEHKKNLRDERYWVYNTYEEWHEQFPFISVRSLKRLLPQMEADGLIISGNYNDHKVDRTKWYTINYEHPALDASDDSVRPSDHSGTMGDPERHDVQSAKVDKSVPDPSKGITTDGVSIRKVDPAGRWIESHRETRRPGRH